MHEKKNVTTSEAKRVQSHSLNAYSNVEAPDELMKSIRLSFPLAAKEKLPAIQFGWHFFEN